VRFVSCLDYAVHIIMIFISFGRTSLFIHAPLFIVGGQVIGVLYLCLRQVELTGPGDRRELLRVKAAASGLLTFSGELTVAGSVSVAPTVRGVPLPGWPRSLCVVPGPASAATSRLASPSNAVVGRPTILVLTTVDAHGNPLTNGGTVVDAVAEEGEGGTERAHVANLGNGTYRLSLTPTAPGAWRVRASLAGVPLHRPAGEVVVAAWGAPSPGDATLTLTNPKDVVVGSPSEVTISVAPSAPPAAAFVSAGLRMRVEGPNGGSPTALTVSVLPDGRCSADWIPSRSGRHVIIATIGGVSLSGSPLEVAVAPGPVDLALVTIPAQPAELVAGCPVSLSLEARDAAGIRRSVGGDGLTVSLGDVACGVADIGDGSYVATVTPSLTEGTGQFLRLSVGLRAIVRALKFRPAAASPVTSRVTPCCAKVEAGESTRLARITRSVPTLLRRFSVKLHRPHFPSVLVCILWNIFGSLSFLTSMEF
jgi:hypothetical protein